MMEPQVIQAPLRSSCADFQIESEALLDTEKETSESSATHDLYICGSPGADEEEDADESRSSHDLSFYKGRSECPKSLDQENLEPRDLQISEFEHDLSLSKETALESRQLNCSEGLESLDSRALKLTIKATSRGSDQSLRGAKAATGTPKACAKKSFVWKYFHHPELASGVPDRSRTQCILCDSQLAFNASGTTTTMLNHLKSRHGDIAEQEELQRRVNRPKGTRLPGGDSHSPNENSDQMDSSGDLQRMSLNGNRISRSPVGQRGRPAVTSRRQKLTKGSEALDYLSQANVLQNCQMKGDGGSVFPLGTYANLSEQQHRALINEMIFSTEGLSALGQDQRHEISALLPGMNLVGLSGHKFDTMADASLSCAANKMFSSSLFPRNSLLSAVSAFSNGTFGLPLSGQLNGPATQELSPSSSSGLGVSVTSPIELNTTSASPTNSTENRSVSSPTQQLHRSGQVSHPMTLNQLPLINEAKPMTNGHLTNPEGHSMQGTRTCPVSSPMVSTTSGNPLGMIGRDGTVNMLSGLQTQSNCRNGSNPTDLADSIGNFMNFFPSLTNGQTATTFPTPETELASQQQQQQYQQQQQQQQQQQWLQTWLASFTNGKLMNNPTNLMDPTCMLNLLTNSTGVKGNPAGSMAMNIEAQASSTLSLPVGSLVDSMQTQTHMTSLLDGLNQWKNVSHNPQSMSLSMPSLVPSNVISNLNQQTAHSVSPNQGPQQFPSLSMKQRLSSKPTTAGRSTNGLSSEVNNASMNYTYQLTAMNSLDLSTNKECRPGSGTYRGQPEDSEEMRTGHLNESGSSSTKRKRARPNYISPQCESKRRTLEDRVSPDTEEMEATDMTNKPSEIGILVPERVRLSSALKEVNEKLDKDATTQITQARFVHQIIRYLVKDMQPPEIVEGEGFRSMIGFLTDCQLPSVQELRATLMPRLVSEAQEKIATQLRAHQDEPGLVNAEEEKSSPQVALKNSDGNSRSVAFSVELWPSGKTEQPTLQNTGQGATVHANLEVHYSSMHSSSFQSHVYDSIKVTDCDSLSTSLQRCYDLVKDGSQNSTNSTSWAIPLVTNQIPFIQNLPGISTDTQLDRFKIADRELLLIPCFVSQLTKAVMTGLNLDDVQNLLRKRKQDCRRKDAQVQEISDEEAKPLEISMEQTDSNSNPELVRDTGITEQEMQSYIAEEVLTDLDSTEQACGSWTEAYTLIQGAKEEKLTSVLTPDDQRLLEEIRTVLEMLNRTLELIHRRDLVLTASMVEPLLQNLCQTHLTSTAKQDGNERQPHSRWVVDQFKASIRECLMQAYPEGSAVRETLQLASLLDPRFKDHSEGKNPSVVALLREKLETIPNSEDTSSTQPNSNDTDVSPGSSSGKTSKIYADTNGLRTVFGLQCFSRSNLSEVDRYLREEPLGLEENPFAWWSAKTSTYPRLAVLANYYLTVPLTSFAVGRLTSVGSPSQNEMNDGLGLPNIVDPLGRDRTRIGEQDQSIYNFLWHNLDMTTVV